MPGRVVELIFKADNRSAVRALSEIGQKSERTANQVKKDSKKTSDSFEQVGRSSHRLHGMISGLAGTVGLGGLAFGFKDAIQGGMALQTAQGQLQAALKVTGQAGGNAFNQLSDAAERLSTHGGFGTPQNIQALTAFTRETQSATKAQSMLSLATNIARGRNVDLSTAQSVVSRAYTGQVGRLQQLLGPMVAAKNAAYGLTQAHKAEIAQIHQKAALLSGPAKTAYVQQQELIKGITPQMAALATLQDKHATATQFMAAAQRVFGNATAAYANTSAGKLTALRQGWQNLIDKLGMGLLPVMNKVINVVSVAVGWLGKHRVVLYALLGAVGAVTAILAAHAAAQAVVEAKNIAMIASNRLLGSSFAVTAAGEEGATAASFSLAGAMDAIPVLALITGLVLLITHFKQVKAVALAVFNWLKTAVSTVVNWIGAHWKLIASILGGPFVALVIFVATHFDQIKHLVGDVIKAIGRAFSTVFNILTWPFRKAWSIIKGIAKDIGGVFKSIGNFAGGALSTATFGLLHTGGEVRPKYLAAGGPSGTDTVPGWLTPGEYVLNRAVVNQVGLPALHRLNSGQGMGGEMSIEPGVTQIRLDSRVIAEAVTRYALRRAARGPSSLVGGSLATNVVGSF